MSSRFEPGSTLLTRRQCVAGLGSVAVAASMQARGRPLAVAPDPPTASALELAAGLRAGRWSAGELAQYYFRRIEALNGPLGRFEDNGALNAFIRIYPDLARRACERADRERRYDGWAGVPVALKDVFEVEGLPVTVGTPAFSSHRARQDCTLWKKWSEAGAVLLGHTQSGRFVSGVTTPQTANPWNRQLIAGGSSGGSAAAVSAGLVPVALGTETSGSLIYPALCCAVTTLKPSHGLLSLAGVFPGAKDFDVCGPLARTAADCAWAAATLAGIDPKDPMTAPQAGHRMEWPELPPATSHAEQPFAGLRFLVATNERYLDRSRRDETPRPIELDPRIRKGFEGFLRSLELMGAQVVPVDIPGTLGSQSVFRVKDPRLGNLTGRRLLEVVDYAFTAEPGLYRWMEQASPAQWQLASEWYGGHGRILASKEDLEEVARVSERTVRIATAARETLRDLWNRLLDRHRCDAHIYLEVGSPLPVRKGLDDTTMPQARRTGVVPTDLGWPVLSLPVAKVEGLDVPISAQWMARRWHDHRLLAWGIAWQQRHPQLHQRLPDSVVSGRSEP